MPKRFFGDSPPEFHPSKDEQAERLKQFLSYDPRNFESTRKSIFKRYIDSEVAIPVTGALAGVLLGVVGLVYLNEREEKSHTNVPETTIPNTTIDSTPPIDNTPPLVSPEFKVDLFEVAAANAAMVEASVERYNQDGALVSEISGGGGLFIDEGGLYFATATKLLSQVESSNDELFVRFTVPVGAGYDPLKYVVPLKDFDFADENPEVVRANFVDYDDSLDLAIQEARIIPLQATSMFGQYGKTVISHAQQESPFLDPTTGNVLSRTVRQYEQTGYDVGFMSDEVSCDADIDVGDFVLVPDSPVPPESRILPLAYAIVTDVSALPDPHNPNSCVTEGTISLNQEQDVYTF